MSMRQRVKRATRTTNHLVRTGSLMLYQHSKPVARLISSRAPALVKKYRFGLAILAAIIITAGVMHTLLTGSNAISTQGNEGVAITKAEMDPGKGKPAYDTVLPSGKTIDQLGGWTRVSPADRNPVFAYADVIDGKNINVSQQPIPEEFKPNVEEQIAHMAKGYLANEKVSVGGITIYIGTSAKGPQSVIFAKNDLLVLIKSSLKISSKDWATYVNSLE